MKKGIGASPGIAIGKVLIKTDPEVKIEKSTIENIEKEIEKLEAARSESKRQIKELYDRAYQSMGEEEAKIFEAHEMIIDDPEFFGQVEEKIKKEHVNGVYALQEITEQYVKIFKELDNEYMKERVADIKDVAHRVIKIMLGVKRTELMNLKDRVIIVAHDLTPSDTAQIHKDKVLGFITEIGGKTSHSAIMARTLEIPAVLGVEGIIKEVQNNDLIILDGAAGNVIIKPEEKMIESYEAQKEEENRFRKKLEGLRGTESLTKDGLRVELVANIGTPKDVEGVISNDGEGVGLYRTEFLYMERDQLPTEEEQFQAYKEVASILAGKPIIIRTLDIGGDKELSYVDQPAELNPFLGYRAIRLCLDQTDIFKTQLRALLRASAYGQIKIMFPMISSLEELRRAREILEEAKEELKNDNIKYNEKLEVGIMVEIPSVAVMADLFAQEVDFFSIGTNDLIQYTTAVDRGNRKIAHLYNQYHPAVLRLIKNVIEKGHIAGIRVGMCGEVAGNPKMIPLLIGMGLDEFSMSPSSILKARWIIRHISQEEMKENVEKVVNMATAQEVEAFIDEKIIISY